MDSGIQDGFPNWLKAVKQPEKKQKKYVISDESWRGLSTDELYAI